MNLPLHNRPSRVPWIVAGVALAMAVLCDSHVLAFVAGVVLCRIFVAVEVRR